MYEDTYFLNAQEAMRVAAQQNRWGENNYYLQVCYYEGEKIDSDLPNLIHLPIENLVEELATGIYRIPSKIDFTGLDISSDIKLDVLVNFNLSIEHANDYRKQYNRNYLDTLKKSKLDFNEPLRFHILASTSTQVMQYVAKNIADELKNSGYDVFFDLRVGIEDNSCFKKILAFNPHATISLNHLNNGFLSDDVFNFVWFQDPMSTLLDNSKVELRKRDYLFSLVPSLDKLLQKKNLPFERQSFCINNHVYKMDDSISREKKIVFIGSSYINFIPKGAFSKVINFLTKAFHSGVNFTDEKIDEIAAKFDVDKVFLETRLIPYIIRDVSVLHLCQIKSDYEIEIYGHGWENYSELKPYFKGPLNYGDDIAKVYNSATFAFAPHQLYVLQQRVLEASACGAIPIVYDCRDFVDDTYEEALVYFKTVDDLEKILLDSNVAEKDFTKLLQENSYERFVNKLIKAIEGN